MLESILGSEVFLAVVGAIVAAIFGGSQSVKLFDRLKEKRIKFALLILEMAILETYEHYVRELKDSTSDGRLTAKERESARALALQKARALGLQHNIDLDATLGEPYLTAFLERVLKKIKYGHEVL